MITPVSFFSYAIEICLLLTKLTITRYMKSHVVYQTIFELRYNSVLNQLTFSLSEKKQSNSIKRNGLFFIDQLLVL